MTTIKTQRGTTVRTQSNRRYILLAEQVRAHRDWDSPRREIVVDGLVEGTARIERRSDNYQTLFKIVQKKGRGLMNGQFTEFTIVDTKGV